MNRGILTIFGIAIIFAVLFGSIILEPAMAKPQPKITICHIPPGNPGNAHSITISLNALPAHVMRHGDLIGECAIPEPNCGDGIITAPETCDDAGDNGNADSCNTTCDAQLSCGDGIITAPETCDDGDTNGTIQGQCNATCDGSQPGSG